MNVAPNIDPDRSRLKRIVVMLLSMALLCERAAARSLPVRLVMFRLLSRAETAALTLFDVPADAADAPRGMPVPTDEADASGGAPVEACDLIRLAARLRGLAMLLALACPIGRPSARGSLARDGANAIAIEARVPARDTPIAPDTS